MLNFLGDVISSIAATILIYLAVRQWWPAVSNRVLYKGIRVDGSWEIIELRDNKQKLMGKISLKQTGGRISGDGERSKTRDGKPSRRQFAYEGSIHGNQMTLLFEDKKGVGFDTGTYMFIIQNDGNTMTGMATFHGKSENQVVSERRILKKVID
ncbi:hypothetical protein [Lysobacter sp. CA196]|uniref:hypothetical protein n=1 Tax=Lysobacter sp. CA196 TaxID=3455606 RepID=UPI003F8D4F3D